MNIVYNSAVNTRPIQSARSRTLWALAAWCTGILLVHASVDLAPVIWFGVAGLVLTAATVFVPRLIGMAMIAALALTSAGYSTLRITPNEHQLDSIVRSQTNEPFVVIECRGLITSRVSTSRIERTPADSPRWSGVQHTAKVSIREIRAGDAWVQAHGQLRVVLPEHTTQPFRAGHMATMIGSYRPPGTARNPGDPDWLTIAAQSNQTGTLYIEHDELITTAPPTSLIDRTAGVLWNIRATLQSRATDAMGLEDSPSSASAVMGALILGYRDPGFNEIYQSFQRIGIAHMLAISGFHVAMMLALAVLCIRIVGDHPKVETFIVIGIIAAIIILLPLRPPILRAVVIVVVLLGAGGFGRRYDRVTVLLWVALGLLILRPLDLFSLGYQLSIGITALLLMLAKNGPADFLHTKHAGLIRSSLQRAWTLTRTNTACWAAATPAIMFHAGVLSFLAPIATLIMLPVIVAMMIAGYVQLGAGMAWPTLANAVEPTTNFISTNATQFTIWLDALPGSSVRAPNFGVLWTLAATSVLAVFILRRAARKNRVLWSIVLAIAAWAILLGTRPHADLLRIDMLDIGNGSCFLIQSGNETILFDAGSLDRRIEHTLMRSSHALNARPIQAAFITHDNLDHFNGLINAPTNLGLKRVYTTDFLQKNPSSAWIFVRNHLLAQGVEIITVHAGDRFTFGNAAAEILWPPKDAGFESARDNNASLVIRWSVETTQGPRTLLMTGDIESETMSTLLALHPGLHADILEAPHHGSPNPAMLAFIGKLNPTVVFQSTGRSRLNDPRLDSIRSHTTWLATADRGSAWAVINLDGTIDADWSHP